MRKKEDDPVSQDEMLSEHSFLCKLFFPISILVSTCMDPSVLRPPAYHNPVQAVSSPACIQMIAAPSSPPHGGAYLRIAHVTAGALSLKTQARRGTSVCASYSITALPLCRLLCPEQRLIFLKWSLTQTVRHLHSPTQISLPDTCF